jgi:hypothetical protein
MSEIAAFPLYSRILQQLEPIMTKLNIKDDPAISIVNLLTRNKIIRMYGDNFANYKYLHMELNEHWIIEGGECECCCSASNASNAIYENHFAPDIVSNICGSCMKKIAGLPVTIETIWGETFSATFSKTENEDKNVNANICENNILFTNINKSDDVITDEKV